MHKKEISVRYTPPTYIWEKSPPRDTVEIQCGEVKYWISGEFIREFGASPRDTWLRIKSVKVGKDGLAEIRFEKRVLEPDKRG